MRTQKKKIVRFRMNSVKTKLIVGMAAFALIPTITLGVISNLYAKYVVTEEINRSSLQLAKEVNHGIDYYLSGVEGQVKQMADNQDFKEYFSKPENQVYRQASLENMQESRADYLNVYFGASNKDMLIFPKQELPAGYDPTQRDWYKNALQHNGKIVVSEPYQDAITKKMVVTLSQAVVDSGQIIGVFAVDIDINDVSEVTNEIVIGKKGYAFILSSDGTSISHQDPTIVGTKELTKLSLWTDIKSKKEGQSQYLYKGQEKISSFYTNEKTGWKIILTLEKQEVEAASKGIKDISVILMFVFGLVSTGIAYIFGRRIAKNVQIVQESLKQASNGDLTTRVIVKSKDEFKELGDSFNLMMENLSGALQTVEDSSKNVLQTSSSLSVMTNETLASVSEVAQAIGEIAGGAVLQAKNIQISSDQINELSHKLDKISHFTSDINDVSKSSSQLSSKGLEQVVLLAEKSVETKDSTNEVTKIVKEVEVKMGEINTILAAISNITDQTNLLSLNASIESARAGEHGRGFAVVANEVRNLAEQSKASAVEIQQIIESIKDVVQKAVQAMEKTNQVVGEQEQVVGETKEIFTEILSSVNNLVQKVEQVKSSVAESQENKEVVVREIDSITAVSQQTAAGTEQVSASAEEISATMDEFTRYASGLRDLSQQLDDEMKKFKLHE